MKRYLILTALAALGIAVFLRSKNPEPRELHGTAMGTTWALAWRGDGAANLEAEVPAVLEKWENVLSQWRDHSDLSRFNHGEPATPELQHVIALAEEIHKASAGAFDYRMLRETSEAGFGPKGNGIDLSGIGKGFAVDRVGERLRELGVTDFIFELGGEVLTGNGEWEVAIETPDPSTHTILRTVKLNNRALATSGNYRQFKPAPGGLSSHIIDFRSRKPIIRPPSSVSVIAADCATADAWATALFVLGSDVPAPEGMKATWNYPKKRE
jgi:thiamine biosynthesis lipoprotein